MATPMRHCTTVETDGLGPCMMEKLQQEHGIPSERIVSMRFDSMDYEDMTAKDMFKDVKEKLNSCIRNIKHGCEVENI